MTVDSSPQELPTNLWMDARVIVCVVAMIGLFFFQQMFPRWLAQRVDRDQKEYNKKTL